MSNKRLYLVIFLITSATLILELSITRLFSVLMYYHFAFMAISIALFGLGASGLYLFIFDRLLPKKNFNKLLSLSCLLMAIATVIALFFILRLPIKPDYSTANIYRLAIIYIVSVVPFFFSGLAVSMILFFRSEDVSRLYFYDLCGAACGAIVTIPLLNLMGGINSQLFAVTLAALAAVIASRKLKSILKSVSYVSIIAAILLLAVNCNYDLLKLQFLKGAARENIIFEKWNSFSHIIVKELPDQPHARAIDIDADARTYILQDPFQRMGAGNIKDGLAPHWISSLPNELLDSGDVLIVGPGGGMDVVFALAWGAKHIDAVEINPIIINDLMLDRFADFSGDLYNRPEVTVHVAEGRSFISHSPKSYDMIQLTLVDTWAATAAGAFSLSENNLYTTEAFVDYISHLNDNGILSITRWLFSKPRQTLRLTTTAVEAAQRLGIISPEKHIAIAAVDLPGAEMQMATFIFKKSPLTTSDMARLEKRVRLSRGSIVYSPFEPLNNPFTHFALAIDKTRFIDEYEFNIQPTTDNQPFFFNTIKNVDLAGIMDLEQESRKNNLGIFNLMVVAVISLVMVLLFLVAPLLFARSGKYLAKSAGGIKSLLYFIAIGLGFILIEIALMQRFVLYLGHPVYSLAVVLACLLVSAGIGSLSTGKYDYRSSRGYGLILFCLILVVIILEIVLLPVLFNATFGYSLAVRIIISLAVLFPLGFLLGQPFPLELKYIEHRFRPIIPWAWGLNGAASVLGSVAAVAIAMLWGFSTVLIAGLGFYLIALITRGWKVPEEGTK